MSALDYGNLEATVVAVLKADDRLDGVTITQETDPLPTADMCPWIGVEITDFVRVPTRIVAAKAPGAPYNETVSIRLTCVEFSGQSAADARRLRNALIQHVEQVLDDNVQLQPTASSPPTVLYAYVQKGSLQSQQGDGGIFAAGTLLLDNLQLV